MEREPQPQSALDTYMIGDRSLRQWHHQLTHDQDDNYTGDLATLNHYAPNGISAAWVALAMECITTDANGEPDDPAASLDNLMGLVVNNSSECAVLIAEFRHLIPEALLERMDIDEIEAVARDVTAPEQPDEPTDNEGDVDEDPLTYSSPRNQALHAVWRNGWANASSGSPNSPTGRFARVSISEAELAGVIQAFSEEFAAIGVDPRQLLGDSLLGTQQGEGIAMEFDTEQELVNAFNALERVYQSWRHDTQT
jgi:hypothetical protein